MKAFTYRVFTHTCDFVLLYVSFLWTQTRTIPAWQDFQKYLVALLPNAPVGWRTTCPGNISIYLQLSDFGQIDGAFISRSVFSSFSLFSSRIWPTTPDTNIMKLPGFSDTFADKGLLPLYPSWGMYSFPCCRFPIQLHCHHCVLQNCLSYLVPLQYDACFILARFFFSNRTVDHKEKHSPIGWSRSRRVFLTPIRFSALSKTCVIHIENKYNNLLQSFLSYPRLQI